MNAALRTNRQAQRGAATLVIVMMLFLIMALLAAYANRSMLFEQRVATSYFRAGLAQEAAEGAVEWTLAQLNGTAIDTACKPVANAGQRFADKYLSFDLSDRRMSSRITAQYLVDCARDVADGGWACRCPAADAAHVARAAMGGDRLTPSFTINLTGGKRSGTIELVTLGCTDSVVDKCRENRANISKAQVAVARTTLLVGLVSAVRTPPAAPLVVKGNVNSSGAGLGLHNSDARSAGLLATIGGAWVSPVESRLDSVPGSTVNQAVLQGDAGLMAASAEAVFMMYMGTSLARYPQHAAIRTLSCNGDCSADLAAAYQAGQRMVWVSGALSIGSNRVLGAVGDPMLIVATGNVTLTGPFQLNGMLVTPGNLSWSNDSGLPSMINGILLVGGDMQTTGRMDIAYQQVVADHLRNRMGSYVRVSGSWIDGRQ
ncbi:pilus assembly PilX family protein [Roseateles sp. LKC17W]|uniref:PilX N-terminal domain-containing pilus assembly protein n=1 Tax=Pelomonas margarita TaxID=3299031 RepID=A0ABW7FIJ6_9BURK